MKRPTQEMGDCEEFLSSLICDEDERYYWSQLLLTVLPGQGVNYVGLLPGRVMIEYRNVAGQRQGVFLC